LIPAIQRTTNHHILLLHKIIGWEAELETIRTFLSDAYPWMKAFHIMAVISWMAGLLYLPRLFVYHAETAPPGSEADRTFQIMERRLMAIIMRPAMAMTWVLGLLLILTPGVADFVSDHWIQLKLLLVVGLSGFQAWLQVQLRAFAEGRNRYSGRVYRAVNEIPAIGMVLIVILVVVRPFG
jgi:putative membrane protein